MVQTAQQKVDTNQQKFAQASARGVAQLNLRPGPSGMFSNVNEVIEHLRRAEDGGYQFRLSWIKSCYRDPEMLGDPWAYYFEPCFPDLYPMLSEGSDLPILPTGPTVACSKDNIITPRIKEGECDPLLLPRDRNAAHTYIHRYLKLKPAVRAEIDRFTRDHFKGPVVAAHIRGPGRFHGGAANLRRRAGAEGDVPYHLYFGAINQALKTRTTARIFVCSDSSEVIERAHLEFGDRVLTYTASRSKFGEMHDVNHIENNGLKFSPYKLGLDVLVEAYLMTRCDFLVHGNSNVANFILCAAPAIDHDYVAA
jgi:hypothetical protein